MQKIKQHLQTIKYWLGEISKHNDNTIKVTENLRIALINLKIEQAHLGETANGIKPIADLIERSINELHDGTKNMVTTGRKALRESYAEVEVYINSKEDK